jgi:hypothetical protein
LAAVPPLPKSFEDAALRHVAVAEELERVCGSSHFRSSRRSCEFLRYVVHVTLDGRMDSLKERSIGIDLFGRDTSYEPSSDATVRVRANEVRKRLSSYYTSSSAAAQKCSIRIDLPTGTYVPRFLPFSPDADRPPATQPFAVPSILAPAPWPESKTVASLATPADAASVVPPIRSLTLMRPALLALLVCALLLRHQLETREEYLRFWDHLLSGRNAMVLSVSPQDRANLASGLYPLVWVAGRYGVDAVLQGDSLAGARPEAASSVQVSYISPPEAAIDHRLRWNFAPPPLPAGAASGSKFPAALFDRKAAGKSPVGFSSSALLTLLPEDSTTLYVQGTDADAIRRLLEELTTQHNFPAGLVDGVERLDSRHALQVLVFRNASGEWSREIYWGEA